MSPATRSGGRRSTSCWGRSRRCGSWRRCARCPSYSACRRAACRSCPPACRPAAWQRGRSSSVPAIQACAQPCTSTLHQDLIEWNHGEQTCSVAAGQVIFSTGHPGTRSTLYIKIASRSQSLESGRAPRRRNAIHHCCCVVENSQAFCLARVLLRLYRSPWRGPKWILIPAVCLTRLCRLICIKRGTFALMSNTEPCVDRQRIPSHPHCCVSSLKRRPLNLSDQGALSVFVPIFRSTVTESGRLMQATAST